jgi:hypothetical protein
MVLVAGGENIGSLQRLREISENVEHGDDAFGCVLGASGI